MGRDAVADGLLFPQLGHPSYYVLYQRAIEMDISYLLHPFIDLSLIKFLSVYSFQFVFEHCFQSVKAHILAHDQQEKPSLVNIFQFASTNLFICFICGLLKLIT